jgi:hypothetical protein
MTRADLEERFWSKVEKTDECWNWTGNTSRGYGRFAESHTHFVQAHRFAYELIRGSIPAGLVLDHLCRNRRCVRPEHLEPVTLRENVLRGDGPTAQRARQSHCIQGHSLDDAYVTQEGYRQCRTCRNQPVICIECGKSMHRESIKRHRRLMHGR